MSSGAECRPPSFDHPSFTSNRSQVIPSYSPTTSPPLANPVLAGISPPPPQSCPEGLHCSPKFFLGCLMQNPGISFEFNILKLSILLVFPPFRRLSIFLQGQKTLNLARRIVILLKLLLITRQQEAKRHATEDV